ncbi:F-box/kelch-repeat protein At1g74510-like isoform X2 [Gastrolobium bilobum]|uniref:F-box/kelch-repeat protein At1g74510-like isoform X2 n=1 Tax=Gastrolobium bilobum TaxID=150636 RepID=UPI002AB0B434|nr:F-box/kelch-repeat protein At1g74510-like isoform X2 [Gastrolobium bilobum]
MLEGPSFLVSRDLPSSCEQETEWIHNTFRVIEHANNKRPLEVEEVAVLRKSCKLSDAPKEGETQINILDRSLYFNQSNDQNHTGDQSDSSSLINQLGRDISINCLLRCSRSDYGSIASLNQSFRSLIRSGELYRLRRQMDKESLAVGTELLVFGKEIISPVIYKYSILMNSWSSGMEMNVPRCLFGSASLGEVAILAGGCDPRGNILSSAELYNSETGTWEILPNMKKARKMCSGVFIDGKFYVIGGIGVGNSKQLTCGEEFDLQTRKWREIPNMFPGRNGGSGVTEMPAAAEAPPLVAVVNNVLYAANYAQQEVRRYYKDSNSWVTIGRLPDRIVSMNGWGLAFRACGNRLIVIGGPRALDGRVIEVNACVPGEGTPQWNLLASKQSGSFVYNCAVMGC